MAKVVSLSRFRKNGKPAVRKAKKRAPRSLDPRRNVDGRVFELTLSQQEGEHMIARRIRLTLLAKGGLEKNTQKLFPNGDTYLVGLVSEHEGRGKWTKATFGGVPAIGEIVSIREIVNDAKIGVLPVKED